MLYRLIFLLFPLVAFAEIVEVDSLKEVAQEWNALDKDALVVFDVDEVLIMLDDQAFHREAEPIRKEYAKSYSAPEKKEEFETLMGICTLLPKRILVEEEHVKTIQALQKRGIKVIALTACSTGKQGAIPSLTQWRIDHLRSLGFDFSKALPKKQKHVFTELATSAKPAPIYDEGILFSTGYTKGDVLTAFLKQEGLTPSRIIFVDDRADNIESVEAALKTLGIKSKSIHYHGAKKHYRPIDTEVVHYQFKHLIKTKEWLSEHEAKKLLNSNRAK